jgi:hypothetical protein
MNENTDLTAFGFTGTNPLWDAIHLQLELYEQAETVMALDIAPQGETRAYLAGKAAGLTEFRQHLLDLRRQVRG